MSDVIFTGTTNPEDDRLFADAMKEAGNVFLGQAVEFTRDAHFTRRILITPYQTLQQAAKGEGLCTITPDADGVVRRFCLSLGDRETIPLGFLPSAQARNFPSANLSGLID